MFSSSAFIKNEAAASRTLPSSRQIRKRFTDIGNGIGPYGDWTPSFRRYSAYISTNPQTPNIK
jgi:hypothetical protein